MSTFEAILQKAIGRGGDTLPAKTLVDVVSKGLDLKGTLELRFKDEMPEATEKEIADKALTAAVTRIEDIISGVLSKDMLSNGFLNKTTKTKKSGKVDIAAKIAGLQGADGRFISAINLAKILNVTLFEHVKNLMVAPALVNDTGRFAHSAHINGITGGKNQTRGSIFFSYMLMPYAVFAGHKTRDPASLIKKAISIALAKALSPSSFKKANFNIQENSK
jgi:hypothetical protein